MSRSVIFLLVVLLGAGCAATKPPARSVGHLNSPADAVADNIPLPVTKTPYLPLPEATVEPELYTVVVNDVPLKELLFALARDANMNVDIHPGIDGKVTLNAVKQTLVQILNRIAEQVPIHYRIENGSLAISPDVAFFRIYQVNYVNMSRNSTNTVSVATEIATTGGSVGGEGEGGGGSGGGNISSTSVSSTSANTFWKTLIGNIEAIVMEVPASQSVPQANDAQKSKQASVASSDSINPLSQFKTDDSTSTKKDSDGIKKNSKVTQQTHVIANPVSGIINVKATHRKHRDVQEFLDQVLVNAQRQVLIEATIVEVELNDQYQAGVDWQWLSQHGDNQLNVASNMLGGNLGTPPAFLFKMARDTTNLNIMSGVRMLETFGNTKVLSSPKIIALNNQTALLKVVDEKVYFNVSVEIEEDEETNQRRQTYSTDIRTVPVGIVMSVTPQINKNGNVTMNVRPTITRITGFVADPTPRLQAAAFGQDATFENLIPEIQVREMESLLQVRDGQTVVLGGLMQNKTDKNTKGIPFLSNLPLVGNLFSYRNDGFSKTELVIFLRPLVVRNPDINTDLREFRRFLPSASDLNKNKLNSLESKSEQP